MDRLVRETRLVDDQQEEINRQISIMWRKRKEAIFQLNLFLPSNGHIGYNPAIDAGLIEELNESAARLKELRKRIVGNDESIEQMMLETENFITIVDRIIWVNRSSSWQGGSVNA